MISESNSGGFDRGLSIKLWPRQLLLSLVFLGLLWGYYVDGYGRVVAEILEVVGIPKLLLHVVLLPCVLTVLHLWLSGKKASGQPWFIMLTWFMAMILVFRPIGEMFMAIISLMPALITYVPISVALIYYRANEEERVELKRRFRKALPLFVRNLGN